MLHKTNKINRQAILSYWLFGGFCILVLCLKLSTILLALFFSLLALHLLNFKNHKIISIILFSLLVSSIFFGFAYFINQAVTTIPEIAERALPDIAQFAQSYQIKIPFSDIHSLQNTVVNLFKTELAALANFARIASKEFIYLIIGIFIALGMFITPEIEKEVEKNVPSQNLYSSVCRYLNERGRHFFAAFKQVMGAQIIISCINTFCTGIFLYVENMPYFEMLVTFTFLCGLLPIIGNIISNCIIFFVAITVSITLAVHALIFLILLHKAEYFLNSKIVGHAIKNPMWLTLFSLVIGERLMGIPGLILAPVFLRYLKKETQIIVPNETN